MKEKHLVEKLTVPLPRVQEDMTALASQSTTLQNGPTKIEGAIKRPDVSKMINDGLGEKEESWRANFLSKANYLYTAVKA